MTQSIEISWQDLVQGIRLKGLEPQNQYEIRVRRETLPILFVPGIMGSKLRIGNSHSGPMAWDPDSYSTMILHYLTRSAGHRRARLAGREGYDSERLVVNEGKLPRFLKDKPHLHRRGWQGISQKYYAELLQLLENADPNNGVPGLETPSDTPIPSDGPPDGDGADMGGEGPESVDSRTHQKRREKKEGKKPQAEADAAASPVKSRRWLPAITSCFRLPVYAFGYNWTGSNRSSGAALIQRIEEIIRFHQERHEICEEVILISHSMGGLVTRSCSQQLQEQNKTHLVRAIIHGAQPVNGAAATVWRMKAGFEIDEDDDILSKLTSKTLGKTGHHVTSLLGNIPGGLQLLPNKHYVGTVPEQPWLMVMNEDGVPVEGLPRRGNPYEEIYRRRDQFWGLIHAPWLTAAGDRCRVSVADAAWRSFLVNLAIAEDFHDQLGLHRHPLTAAFAAMPSPPSPGERSPKRPVRTIHDICYVLQRRELEPCQERRANSQHWLTHHALTARSQSPWDSYENGGFFEANLTDETGVHQHVRLLPANGVGDVTVPIPSGLALDPSKTRVFYDISHEMVFKDFSPGGAVDWTMTQIEAACIRKLKKAQSTSAEKRTLCISTDHDTQAA